MERRHKVAVKVFSKSSGAESSGQPEKPFLAEAQLLTIVHHGNLVSLKGYCDDSKNKALIYEFIANRNLKQHLSGQDVGVTGAKPNVLTWDRRLRIAVEVAQGLDYLHNSCIPSIIHRDIKTTNILLNENMQAKISDFGLSRPLAAANGSYMSTSPLGTPAYLPPEYKAFAYELNKKSDVYSFGIVLLELISGHPAINTSGDGKSVHIREWAIPKFKNGNIRGLINPKVEEKFDIDSAEIAAKVAESYLKRAIELASKHKYVDGNQEEHIEATSLEVELDNAPRRSSVIADHFVRRWPVAAAIAVGHWLPNAAATGHCWTPSLSNAIIACHRTLPVASRRLPDTAATAGRRMPPPAAAAIATANRQMPLLPRPPNATTATTAVRHPPVTAV
ncbi:probable LRR receptor-like serine/threonine-protein kinase At1g51880 [Eucalyptus grandis]|uniref:probable LRR receptor-like serine/threonine-protein kinase At1g51880 n=1 Tax=Eucalyptus grandis TaxID=71139 RepID=UPI00192EA148|nr:probable LRR receptor-like serine/threonine-protein kinase At1g51880 [Eucalyptus grandis]